MPFVAKHPKSKEWRTLHAMLIFNPSAGEPYASDQLLTEILSHLQAWKIRAEPFIVRPHHYLEIVAAEAVQRDLDMVIVCGGDGTIDTVMNGLVGTRLPLGIIPTGTQNNTARSLDIPLNDIGKATGLLRRGRKLKLDVGLASCAGQQRWFLEAATVGLLSALFPAADSLQHGDLTRVADLLATLVTSQPAEYTLHLLDEHNRWQDIQVQAHMALISNMPLIGMQFQPAENIRFNDNLLDLFLYGNLTKIDLIGYAVQAVQGVPHDSRIQHIRFRQATITTQPPMPVLVDGFLLGKGEITVSLHQQGLRVLAGPGTNARLEARALTGPDYSGDVE